MLLSKARYFEHELLMVKASSFTNKSGQRSFIFWFLGAGWLRILFDSKGFVFGGTLIYMLVGRSHPGITLHYLCVF